MMNNYPSHIMLNFTSSSHFIKHQIGNKFIHAEKLGQPVYYDVKFSVQEYGKFHLVQFFKHSVYIGNDLF